MNARLALMSCFALAGFAFIAVALVVGISDNLPGVALMYLGALGLGIAVGIAVAHWWQYSHRYLVLIIGSILSFLVFVILENVMEAADGLEIPAAIAFIIATVVCPVVLLVGIGGAITGRLTRGRPV